MLDAIETIETLRQADLATSATTRLALERAFEILSEASRYIPTALKERYPTVRWQDLADLGNILRHAYHRISYERLAATAQLDVPPLKVVLLLMQNAEV